MTLDRPAREGHARQRIKCLSIAFLFCLLTQIHAFDMAEKFTIMKIQKMETQTFESYKTTGFADLLKIAMRTPKTRAE